MLAYKGTLKDRTAQCGFSYPMKYEITGEYRHVVNAIHACIDPYMVFLYGRWQELWLIDLDVVEKRGSVVSGSKVEFLKQLSFQECISFTKDPAQLAYYWVVNFAESMTEAETSRFLPYIYDSEECVISWAENIKTHIVELRDNIHTPRYAYLWRLEGFPTDERVEGLADEYTQITRNQWSSK